MNPYVTIGAVVAIAAGVATYTGFVYRTGVTNGRNALIVEQQDLRIAEEAGRKLKQRLADKAAATTEAELSRLRRKNATLQQEVSRYASQESSAVECLDADGVQLWQRASRSDDSVSGITDDTSTGESAGPPAQ